MPGENTLCLLLIPEGFPQRFVGFFHPVLYAAVLTVINLVDTIRHRVGFGMTFPDDPVVPSHFISPMAAGFSASATVRSNALLGTLSFPLFAI